jgi:hypothetical protein
MTIFTEGAEADPPAGRGEFEGIEKLIQAHSLELFDISHDGLNVRCTGSLDGDALVLGEREAGFPETMDEVGEDDRDFLQFDSLSFQSN